MYLGGLQDSFSRRGTHAQCYRVRVACRLDRVFRNSASGAFADALRPAHFRTDRSELARGFAQAFGVRNVVTVYEFVSHSTQRMVH